MIIDTSAVVAILYGEPEAAAFTRLIHDAVTSRFPRAPIHFDVVPTVHRQCRNDNAAALQ
jgi:uncharacterized protein with PIN domain